MWTESSGAVLITAVAMERPLIQLLDLFEGDGRAALNGCQ